MPLERGESLAPEVGDRGAGARNEEGAELFVHALSEPHHVIHIIRIGGRCASINIQLRLPRAAVGVLNGVGEPLLEHLKEELFDHLPFHHHTHTD